MVLYKNINFVLVCAIVLLVGICVWLSWDRLGITQVQEENPKVEEVQVQEVQVQEVQVQEDKLKLDTWETHLFRLQTHGLGYPPTIKSRFFYETSVCGSDPSSSVYQDRWIESPDLDLIQTQDYTPFLEQIQDGSDINQIARSFYNKPGDTLLIIPYPHQTIQYPTIKEFIDQAPPETKTEFWKFVVDQIKQFILTHGQVYVSTHGLDVSYFHLRLCTYPKYYHSQDII